MCHRHHALGEVAHAIRRGEVDVMLWRVAGAAITPFAYASFLCDESDEHAQRRARTAPAGPSTANAMVYMGRGAASLLESLERWRGARIYCEPGCGDLRRLPHHQPDPEGKGLRDEARWRAQPQPEQIDYISPRTSTPYNDKFETFAIKKVFGDHARKVAISSTKSMTGHLLGAAGGVESIVCVKTIQTQTIAPTINLEEPDAECDLDYVPNVPRQAVVQTVLSNNLGFGGQNAAVVFRKLAL